VCIRMNKTPDSIPKQPVLKPAEDYYRLRREGIGFIEQMASALWTDYNTHDPGITILESLCYAMTDLAYRSGWPIADLLMPNPPSADPDQPYPDQAFFTAREILTVNPVTPDDFRRLLIDLEAVRNAWIFRRQCACEASYYAWCEQDRLQLAFQPPEDKPAQTVSPQGLYDVLLELEADPELGDLNNRKITHSYDVFDDDGDAHTTLLEVRFPDWGLAEPEQWTLFIESGDAFAGQNGQSFSINSVFGAAPGFDAFDAPDPDQYLRDHWRQLWYVRFELELSPGLETIVIESATLRLFGDTEAKNQATALGMKTLFEDITPAGFIQRYRNKLLKAQESITAAKDALQGHRNLDEDYCRITPVNTEDITVCADVEVAPDADIERVQAEIWLRIEGYLNPPVPFRGLQELLDAGTPVEDIFNGPELSHGFIKQEDLDASVLKTVLRTSDLVNSLMDIEGVIAVNNLLLSKYDSLGNLVKGAADPSFTNEGKPLFDTDKISAAWLLYIRPLHQPRFHRELSRFLFFKNGLPFLPRKDEANDTLIQLRGELERILIGNESNDLPIPEGRFRDPESYFPLQYGFPLAYGIGPEGLPFQASAQRKAQARQLKAYLLVFEQLIANAQAQIAHTADLFSLDPEIIHSYFVNVFNNDLISGYDELHSGLTEDALHAMAETETEFHERRNRFLNHLMARFGEQFGDYALLLTNAEGIKTARKRLVEDKIAFLKAYPGISHDRGKAFNYRQPAIQINRTPPVIHFNQPGIKKRVSLLLGFPDLSFIGTPTGPDGGPYAVAYQVQDAHQTTWFSGELTVPAGDSDTAGRQAFRTVLERLSREEAYEINPEGDQFRLELKDAADNPIGQSALFATESDAEAFKEELLNWSANERAIVVEHLLLRPKFPGDALYPACSDGGCKTCGDEDPYSFRLTWVMPGWTEAYNSNLELRAFAERTIRQETPSHLLAKICWAGNGDSGGDAFDRFEEAWLLWLKANADIDWTENRLSEQLEAMLKAGLVSPANADVCLCGRDILETYGDVFHRWLQTNVEDGNDPDNLSDFEPVAIILREEGSNNVSNFCPDLMFKTGTGAKIQSLLNERYADYRDASYRLRQVVALLAGLGNTYPEATLHDCDDGSDLNPVRLGQTALGSLPGDGSSPATS
jgi:hypothetical protein